MKRDFDLIRDILLKMEELPNIEDYIITEEDLPDYEFNIVTYHIMIMIEAGLIYGKCEQVPRKDGVHSNFGRKKCYGIYLTWSGCELLESIRDKSHWNKIKESIIKASLPVSLEVIKNMASAYISKKIGIQ